MLTETVAPAVTIMLDTHEDWTPELLRAVQDLSAETGRLVPGSLAERC